MKKRILYYSGLLVIMTLGVMVTMGFQETEDTTSKLAKTALREVGHQLLLANEDSTSLVLPVIKKEDSYRISFQKTLAIQPDSLVALVERSLHKGAISKDYLVEVLQCDDTEVAYSYAVLNEEENNIIPCRGRGLPEDCYTLQITFNKQKASFFNKQTLVFIVLLILTILLVEFLRLKKGPEIVPALNGEFTHVGSFRLYPEQNKLVKEAEEISLSVKECQLLTLLAAQPNAVIKREELTKKVWEDNGVVVGRSLDTYISKLRKKLKDDESIKISNVHGVGYKLEVKG
ncbi:winged helix-turn-helix domain-containing protein [Aureisphaera galaxeae]|uniref:winged helix-turn-helix domain-containing protein n=1 Tax=Aureisphaera galaxeae TaxID=1538023 RepID=UPI0023508121|nr:winged helix-turn-helix domain-containing protein [Aureisphaera galaxeae]MDC8004313.1 winged helix-turn-helix domain-containing protein [Aureisphaera galaxeae]